MWDFPTGRHLLRLLGKWWREQAVCELLLVVQTRVGEFLRFCRMGMFYFAPVYVFAVIRFEKQLSESEGFHLEVEIVAYKLQ